MIHFKILKALFLQPDMEKYTRIYFPRFFENKSRKYWGLNMALRPKSYFFRIFHNFENFPKAVTSNLYILES